MKGSYAPTNIFVFWSRPPKSKYTFKRHWKNVVATTAFGKIILDGISRICTCGSTRDSQLSASVYFLHILSYEWRFFDTIFILNRLSESCIQSITRFGILHKIINHCVLIWPEIRNPYLFIFSRTQFTLQATIRHRRYTEYMTLT